MSIKPLLKQGSKENVRIPENQPIDSIPKALETLALASKAPTLTRKPSLKLRVTGKPNLKLALPDTPKVRAEVPTTPKSVRRAKFRPCLPSLPLPTPKIQILSSEADEVCPSSETALVIHTQPTTSLSNLSPRDRRLIRFINNPECIVTHLKRGAYNAYLVKDVALRHLLSTNPRIGELIAEYSQMKINGFYQAISSKRAILKPADESRGMENARHLQREQHADKDGVPKECASFNEYIPRLLGLLDHTVAITQASSPAFYIRDKRVNGTIEKTVVAIQAIPGKTLDKIDLAARSSFLRKISQESYEKMALLDIYFCNTDRNAGNVICNKGQVHPIDHAAILPAGFASHANFIWMNWPQAHRPWSQVMQQKIQSLDPSADMQRIKEEKPDYPQANLDIMEMTAYLLKEGTKRGFTPFQLGLFFAAEPEGGALLQYMYAEATQSPEKPTELMKVRILCLLEHLEKHPELMESLDAWRPGLLCHVPKNITSTKSTTT